MADVKEIFTTAEAAEFICCSRATLDTWRTQGRGPPYFTINRMVRYRRCDVELWAFAGPIAQREIAENAECHAERLKRTKRPRGRKGKTERERRLAEEPNCRDCASAGYVRPAEHLDHIVPIAFNGTNDDENVRALCRSCHWMRTREQRRIYGPPPRK